MPHRRNTGGSHINGNRRRFIQSIGAMGAVAAAGCVGGDDEEEIEDDPLDDEEDSENDTPDDAEDSEDNEVEEDDGDGGPVEDWFVTAADSGTPSNFQFNQFNPDNFAWEYQLNAFMAFAKYDGINNELIPGLAENWEVTETETTIEIEEGHTWGNLEEPVTAQDYVTQLTIEEAFDHPIWDMINDVYAEDDHTVVMESDTLNTTVAEHLFVGHVTDSRVRTPDSIFGEYRERLEDATSDEEVDAVVEDLVGWRMEEPIGNGPVICKSRDDLDETYALLRPNEGHPHGKDINWNGIVLHYHGSPELVQQSLIGNESDGTRNLRAPQEVWEQLPEHFKSFTIPVYAYSGLMINHDHPYLGQRKFRQAIAYIIDRPDVVATMAGDPDAEAYPRSQKLHGVAGEPQGVPQEWIEDYDSLRSYETDHEAAGELLEEIGLEEQDGQWVDDGEPVSLDIRVQELYPVWSIGIQRVASQLDNFGFNADFTAMEATAYWDTLDTADYDIATDWVGELFLPGPYFDYNAEFGADSYNHTIANYPREVSVPMPVGDFDGSEETIDLHQKIEEFAVAQGDEYRRIANELAWIFNVDLPAIPMFEQVDRGVIADDAWKTPDTNDPMMNINNPVHWLAQRGLIEARTECSWDNCHNAEY